MQSTARRQPSGESNAAGGLNVRLLGGFAVSAGGAPVDTLRSARLQALLAYLLIHSNAPQSRQHVAFIFWPDSSEDQALANLRNLLFSLRRALPEGERYLKSDHNMLRWNGDAEVDVDLLRFEEALARAGSAERSGRAEAQEVALRSAVELYRGDLLPGFYEEWVLAERERLQQSFTAALESLIGIFQASGDARGAIEASKRLLRHNPLHEAMCKRLMDLYAANDMVAEALRTYHACATTLARELGVEPSPHTREAYERLLATRKPAAQSVAGMSSSEPAAPPPRPGRQPKQATGRPTPLQGREAEWRVLLDAWRDSEAGPRAVLVTGEAGIGKTRLVEELYSWVARQGVAAAAARSYPIERRLAFGPVADWLQALPLPQLESAVLAEVARLRPATLTEFAGVAEPGALTEAWQRRRFMEALSQALVGHGRLLLCLDDLQWCDADTLEFLHFLLRFDSDVQLLVVATARTEELSGLPGPDQTEVVGQLLDHLRDIERLTEIELAPLDPRATAELAAAVSGVAGLDALRADELYRESEGNPLFIVEMVRTGWLERPSRTRTQGRHEVEAGLPPRIARVLGTRLAQLSAGARRLVDIAAVIGRDFTLSLLQAAAGESESAVVAAVDELWRRRVFRDQGEASYDFAHDKLRQAAYAALAPARRSMLHGRVASALEQAGGERLDAASAQLAVHYELAGNLLPAARHYHRAAAAARRLFANQEAQDLYQRALELADLLAAGHTRAGGATGTGAQEHLQLAGEITEELADLLETTGNHAGARRAYQQALANSATARPLVRARLLLKTGDTWKAQRDTSRAARLYGDVEALLGKGPTEPETEWWGLWIDCALARLMLHYWRDEPEEMRKITELVEPGVERHATPVQKMKYYRCLTMMQLRLDRYDVSDSCMRYVEAALEETRRLDSLTELADTTFLMGFCLLWRIDLSPAVTHLEEALALAERTGQADYQLLALAYLSVAYRMLGDVERTRETVARHVSCMQSVQVPSYREIAEANLAWIAWRQGDLVAARRYADEALPGFGEGESFGWLVIWPMVAISLAEKRVADAAHFAAAQLQPHARRAPDSLLSAVRGALEAADSGDTTRAVAHLERAIDAARVCHYL